MKYKFLIYFLSLLLISCNKSNSKKSQNYNELENPNKLKTFTISDYNRDNAELKNIERPNKSVIKSDIDTTKLFKIWVSESDSPNADFEINKNYFYIVDYDGNGEMPYELINHSLKVYYNDFVQEGKIISVDDEKLKIRWKDSESNTEYEIFKN